jgi:hypothetical protein
MPILQNEGCQRLAENADDLQNSFKVFIKIRY